MLFDLGLKDITLLKADSTPNRLTVLEKNKRRHRLNTVTLRKLDIFIYINLQDIGRIAYLVFDFLENRALHTARATPSGKKIDQRRFIAFDQFIKIVHNIFL